MDGNEERPERGQRFKRRIAAAGLIGSGVLAGAVLGGMHVAGAASNSSSTSTTANPAAGALDPSHGAPGEVLLTGTTATKVKAAALKAVPGATIIRVETDSEGSPYEAHMRKADGSLVTVKINKSFAVTSVIDGFGMGGPHGAAGSGSSGTPSGATQSSSNA
ncbi:MAG: hypothetical protein E6G68_08230 [Actinobacteria bacterium]|nr:MAG: hypothetical protein E6G68_08230 [Actinomycetota bacterium]